MVPKSKLLRLILGVILVLPLAFLLQVAWLIAANVYGLPSVAFWDSFGFDSVMLVLAILAPFQLALMIWLAIVIHRSPSSEGRRAVWLVLLLFAYAVTAPFVWYVFVWRSPDSGSAKAPASASAA